MKELKVTGTSPSTSKTIIFPNDMLKKLEKAIAGTDCSLTTFVVEAVKLALEKEKQNYNKAVKFRCRMDEPRGRLSPAPKVY